MASEEINKELHQLKSDIADLRQDMASLIHAMKNAGTEKGRHAYERVYEKARTAGESVHERADQAYGTFEKEIEDHPLASVLTAFGTGFVVGMLLDRRHH